ncbi:MAG: hypothetical protein EBX65_01160 [Betaproteobacteria bacterium]|nr:hypothetical protein [Betaproteobacteria bacterium]
MHTTGTGHAYFRKKPQDKVFNPQPVFTAPQKKEWVGLTDEEIEEMHYKIKAQNMGSYKTQDIYRAIESKLKEKNT